MSLQKPSHGLCEVCQAADFLGIFTFTDYTDGKNPYRADLHAKKQVPRTWEHLEKRFQSCSFCRITYQQLQHHGDIFERKVDKFGQPEQVAIVEITTGSTSGNITHHAGLHNGTYRHPRHSDLVIRGLQLAAHCAGSEGEWKTWLSDAQAKDKACLSENLALARSVGGRAVMKEHIDFDLCKRWLQDCIENHEKCQSPELNRPASERVPTRVIDVVAGQLVTTATITAGDFSYAALSYVWGCQPEIQLESSNEEYLRNPGTIVPSNTQVPQTIRDAITYCLKIGLCYLWVDSLCIVQDSSKDQEREIPRMFEIYSGAALTLVALSCTSSQGPLPGVNPGTRVWHQYFERVKGLDIMSCYPSLLSEIENSAWRSRGWTLQEAAFSRRLLFFTLNQAIFLCRQKMLCEDSVWEDPETDNLWAMSKGITEASSIAGVLLLNASPKYAMKRYFSVVEEFTRRRLTVPSDVLKACDAVIQWVSRDEEQGSKCHYGLPEKRFGAALGWVPEQGHLLGPMSRRHGFPSWSWAGWKGPIKWELFHSAGLHRVSGWESASIIEPAPLDEELREKTGLIITPTHQHPERPSPRLDFISEGGTLQFWTSSAMITISRKEADGSRVLKLSGNDYHFWNRNLPTFEMMKLDGSKSEYFFQCDPYWRSKQPDQLEFIVIAASKLKPPNPPVYSGFDGCGTTTYRARRDGNYFTDYVQFQSELEYWETHMQNRVELDLMCIERVDGLAQRVQMCHAWKLEDWLSMEPQEKLIRLG